MKPTKWPDEERVWTETSDLARLSRNPVVSVIMVTYSHERYLAQAIESVLNQRSDFAFELIVSDDCSPDKTREIALEYQRRYPECVRFISPDRNVGPIGNCHHALTVCRGEFVAFCDGDDYWTHPQRLAEQVNFLRANPTHGLMHGDFQNLVFVAGRWRVSDPVRGQAGAAQQAGDLYGPIQRAETHVVICTALIRRALTDAWIASSTLRPSYLIQDWPLTAFAAKHAMVGYSSTPLGVYRRTPGSLMNSGSQASVDRARGALEVYADFVAAFGPIDPPDWDYRQVVASQLYSAGYGARNALIMREALDMWPSGSGRERQLARARSDFLAVAVPPIWALRGALAKLREIARVLIRYRPQ